ncbi:MAG: hypothetical protein JRN20_20800 [Nitrososphaerota archaeon]|jgi:hypothetical protein|nr:hypothetical protein [Nitrososphaerota archaeon]
MKVVQEVNIRRRCSKLAAQAAIVLSIAACGNAVPTTKAPPTSSSASVQTTTIGSDNHN